MKRIFESGSFWFAFSAALLLVAGVVTSVIFWGWLHPQGPPTASNSETLRNVGLLIGGGLAFVFAGWRASVAERQVETAQQGLLNERYQKGAEMLGSNVLSVRLGGIYALQRLAEERPKQYHVQIMRLFCAFVRPTETNGDSPDMVPEANPAAPTAEVQAIMEAIGGRGEDRQKIEDVENYRLDLRRVKLSIANLGMANLSSARLAWAHLDRANLREANLSKATLNQAVLNGAWLGGAKLLATSLRSAKLQDAFFWGLPGPVRFITYADAKWHDGFLTADLSGARLTNSDMSKARLQGSDLSRADLTDAVLINADLSDTNLFGTVLDRANLTGTKFSDKGKTPAMGFIQSQLDQAYADSDNPPNTTVAHGRLGCWTVLKIATSSYAQHLRS